MSDEIFYEYSIYKNARLLNVENYKNKFIIALFNEDELIIPYNAKVEKLLESLIGQNAFEIAVYCDSLGLKKLAMQLKDFLAEDFKAFNISEIIAMAQNDKKWAQENLVHILNGKLLSMQKVGLHFYKMFLSYKFYVELPRERKGEVLLMGRLYRDYLRFIKNLTKE